MKVAITGGTGFIGRKLIEVLKKQNYEINVITRTNNFNDPNINYYICDLTSNTTNYDEFLDGVSVIYHCAGEINDKKLMHYVHVDGTSRLLHAVSKQIKLTNRQIHWVQLSSVGAYGPPTNGQANQQRIVDEQTLCAPLGEYEVTKTIADELIINFSKNEKRFSYTILRPSNVIGASMPNRSFCLLIEMIRKRLFFYIGSRTAIATYINVEDVAFALALCGQHSKAKMQVFNLSNDCLLSDVVKAASSEIFKYSLTLCLPEILLRKTVKISYFIKRFPLSHARIDALVRHTNYPATKIKNLIGFVPQHSIESTVKAIIEEKLDDRLT